MIQKEDLTYLCTNLANLSGLPVRMYEDGEQTFFHSTISFFKDPFEIDKESALLLTDPVSYFQTPFYYYYGIVNLNGSKIVVGPTRQIPVSKQELRSISFSLGIPPSESEEFCKQMEALVPLPLMSLLQILCMVYFSFTGERLSLESVTIHETTQELFRRELGKEQAEQTMDAVEGHPEGPYTAFDIENRMMDMVMRGDVSALKRFFATIPAVRSGTVAQEQLRQSKNIFIVSVTLVSRAAIRGGMEVTAALALSDLYIQKCELAPSIDQITELNYLMVMDYCERMEKIRFGQSGSKLAIAVSNYVQQHLSEPIKTSDVAKALYMGRSRLSTNFKNETGVDLSDFILIQKIDEAKRLLRYSDKTLIAIALYLGFSSQSHFSKVFKKYASSSPNEYRAMHKHY